MSAPHPHPARIVQGFCPIAMAAFGTMLGAVFIASLLTFPAVAIGFLSTLAIEIDHAGARGIRELLVWVALICFMIGAPAEAIRRLSHKGD